MLLWHLTARHTEGLDHFPDHTEGLGLFHQTERLDHSVPQSED